MATALLRRFAELAATPLVPDDYLDLFNPLRPGAELRGRIVSVHPETADAATLVIKPGADWAGHVPGQYVRIGVDVDGVRQWRAYSLTHGPRRDGHISITVKAVADGTVSPYLVHRSRPGTLVHLEQATGDFVLPDLDVDPPKFLFVTAGSGVTPVVGMLRNLFPVTESGVIDPKSRSAATNAAGLDITVVHVAPSEPDSIFGADLVALHAAGAINLVARYDDTHGVLDINRLVDLVPDLHERITYACGPGGLLDALAAHHEALGLPLHVEQFKISTVEPGAGGSVAFNSGVEVIADGATPILTAAESAGVLMPSGCRMGICFGCVLPMTDGAVRDLRNGAITTADAMSGPVKIQTCISAAAGPCRLDH
ncbi:ferredoxin reductase [Nocardioides limicola]|uniref:ferredoxin reductase n=1 Tax=Nocardioides limicola TaxID=2803368 RepID=UPI00193BD386|nr:ferredoxin reductase [Nocardioides sp. DJM-14]